VPLFSAILPGRGSHSVVAALDGFLGQTVPASDLEILLVAPPGPRVPVAPRHRRLRIRTIAWPRGGYLAAAINAGARAARGSIVAVIDPQWRPLPGLVDYCLVFHARETGGADLLSLTPAIDPEVADDPLLWWLQDQQLAGLGSLTPGIHNWRAVRFDAFSAKRDFLRAHPIPAAHDDEVLMRAMWARKAPVRAFVEPVPVLVTAERPDLELLMDREYRGAYARAKAIRASLQTFAGEVVDDRFQHPERYILSTPDLLELAEAIAAIEQEMSGRHPRFAVGADAERFELLGKLYLAAVSHARSTGWTDAKAKRRSAILHPVER
jgi:hypothetical protein